jgi:spectinomycin phosphotransferase
MREQPSISGERLRAGLQAQYNLVLVALDFLPLGLDYRAGVYRIVNEQGMTYLLKVKSGTFYEPGCLVPGYLRDQGIASVVAPIPTRNHSLWSEIDNWTVMVYPFLEGETSWEGMTDEQWMETGSILKEIHGTILPPSGFELLRKETFDPSSYARWVKTFEARYLQDLGGVSAAQYALGSSWHDNRPTIHAVLVFLEEVAKVLHGRNLPSVLCHADLHPANLLRDPVGHVHLIDWDEVMLAPKERDFLFIKESLADSQTLPGSPRFFEGYGGPDIDWIALAYYRYERVLQDVIACAETVFLRDDVGEDSRTDEAQLFQDVLAEGGEIDAAIDAATHLPPDLPAPRKQP